MKGWKPDLSFLKERNQEWQELKWYREELAEERERLRQLRYSAMSEEEYNKIDKQFKKIIGKIGEIDDMLDRIPKKDDE